MLEHMFQLPHTVTFLEKVLRPVLMYICLILFLRLFGKRELAQLNPFDLVVLLTLSNTVQNAIIGEDNSLVGGLVGAFSLLGINWLIAWLLYRLPKVQHLLEGGETVLIRHGKVEPGALKRERLTHAELISAIHKEGFSTIQSVEKCVLQPNGTFYVEGKKPSPAEERSASLQASVDALRTELEALRRELKKA